MTGGAVVTAARGGAARRMVQTAVVFLVVGAAAAAGTVGLTLETSANLGFYASFNADHGADLAVTINASKVTSAELARTRHLPGVTQAAGPYPETYILLGIGRSGVAPARRGRGPGRPARKVSPPRQPPQSSTHAHAPRKVTRAGQPSPGTSGSGQPSSHRGPGPLIPRGPVNPDAQYPGEGVAVVGRASMGGPLDHVTGLSGRWATRPGEIVLGPDRPVHPAIGGRVTVTSAPGKPVLTMTGSTASITGAEQAWVAPSQLPPLRPKGAPALDQMLYTFSHAATSRQVNSDLAVLKHALPAGAVVNWVSWLSQASAVASPQGVNTPFAIAYGIIGLALAVLITASVVSAAVVAGYRRIGVLKSIGFTPLQVAAAYLAQIGIPALIGAAAGTALGNYWVVPLLGVAVPSWINITVPAGLLALTGLAALVPALRAGRLSAVAAIAAGQVPRAGHGFAVHWRAGRLALPRPVSIGLAAPFTRPARSAVMLGAVTFGLTAVVLATGLEASIAKINAATAQPSQTAQVGAGNPPGGQPLTPGQRRAITAALRAQPATQNYLAEASTTARVPGVGPRVPVTAYTGDAAQLSWDLTSGTWYTRPGEVVVNSAQPGTAHLAVGQAIQMIVGGKTISARISGEIYTPGPPQAVGVLFTSQQTFAGAGIHLPTRLYQAVIRPGTSQQAYTTALGRALGPGYGVSVLSLGITTGNNHQIHGVAAFALIDTSLMRLLTVMVAVLAALGVLNAVLMLARERVHDLGIYKAVGMTPRQVVIMVTCWVIPPAITAALIALPAGMALQDTVIHAIGVDQAIPTPGGVVHVYTAGELTLLALAGLAIAIAGALGPAAWAATSRTTTALRAE
jgi:putative ABC transport system permease protein